MTRPIASPALSHLRVLDLTRVRAGPRRVKKLVRVEFPVL
jgi:hypothetical protein